MKTKYAIAFLLFIITLCVFFISVIHKYSYESFITNNTQSHLYWIVSEKRKPYVLQQIRQRNLSDIVLVPGIFSDTPIAEYPELPKAWLGFPVVRLLAAHMRAIRLFQNNVQSLPDKQNHVFVCMEDDIVLHKNFEGMVQQAAEFLQGIRKPARLLLGYANPPVNVTPVKRLTDTITINKVNSLIGDPWGTQCYMMNASYVDLIVQKYQTTYKSQSPDAEDHASDHFLFHVPEAEHYVMEPPVCLEDFPTFGSMLGHGYNSQYYAQMISKYDRAAYHVFA